MKTKHNIISPRRSLALVALGVLLVAAASACSSASTNQDAALGLDVGSDTAIVDLASLDTTSADVASPDTASPDTASPDGEGLDTLQSVEDAELGADLASVSDTTGAGETQTPIATVTIGSQVWMAENLRVPTPGSRCYDDDPKSCESDGRLYTFEQAKSACPVGFRLPSDEDWKALESALGMSTADLDLLGFSTVRGKDEGDKLRVGGSSGLELPMAGYATPDGYFSRGDKTYLWSSTVLPNGQVIRRRVEAHSPTIFRFSNPAEGFWISVRCVKQ